LAKQFIAICQCKCSAQFISEKFDLHRVVLNIAEKNDAHTAVNIASTFAKMLDQWHLTTANIVAMTVDGAAIMKAVCDAILLSST
jgi:predicted HAD superfamily Cof-like phosphohydrolase